MPKRVLLDECLPRHLKRSLVGHEVRTVPEADWASKENGELLSLAADKYDVFVTVDRNLTFQQNLEKFRIAIVVLVARGNRLKDLMPLGVGLVLFDPDPKEPNYQIRVRAQRFSADMFYVNELADRLRTQDPATFEKSFDERRPTRQSSCRSSSSRRKPAHASCQPSLHLIAGVKLQEHQHR